MLMTDREISDAIKSGGLKIVPCDPNRQQGCSYDARLGKEALVTRDYKLIDVTKANSVTLEAGDFALVMTEELFQLPMNMAAHIGTKSSLARRGLILLAGLQIDPGFEGHLRLGFYNGGGRPITIDYLDPICLIEFHHLTKEAETPPPVIPALKEGRIPNEDKAFLRELETTSLSEVASEMRTVAQSMSTLATITYKVILPVLLAIFAGILLILLSSVLSK